MAVKIIEKTNTVELKPKPTLSQLETKLMPEDEAVLYLQMKYSLKRSVHRLRRLRVMGVDPAFIRIGRNVLYRAADLDAWVESITTKVNTKVA